MTSDTSRRTVLGTGAAAALALGTAACGGNKNSSSTASPASPTSPSPTSPPANGSPSSPAAGGQALATTAEIPEGGGKIFKAQKVVVTQPSKGDYKAFSAICTHMGCTVSRVADGTIDCPCHGSKYHIADGAVAHGPATRPLPPKSIKVEGNSIRLT
ncbi:Rieske (2Fe-2S) protein [Streptomyces sp. AF1A]|jgi:Rieske Fe-S protein|uniref:Rieske (2Fe-2S) protein n=1 Tax=Streptomyces sp. AF1A TaxID=3394350 RepID=UPI0039BC9174